MDPHPDDTALRLRSAAKARAAVRNGRKGGRPPGKKKGLDTREPNG